MRETKLRILSLVMRGYDTADAIAAALSIQKSAVRRHLEDLINEGKIISSYRAKGVGRPARVYTPSEEGREALATRYSELMNLLVGELKKDSGRDKEYMQRVAEKVYSQAIDKEEASFLNDFGFMVKIEEEETKKRVLSYNCPVIKLAMEHHEAVCQSFHSTLLKRMFDARDVKLVKCMVWRDQACEHVID
ncbi:MAG: ArsR family transcriptional regulator [Conexivisphaerales archaeon]